MIVGRMPVSDTELATLSASYDIITLGVKADEVRRARHGSRTTFVRVADIACEPGAAVDIPAGAGEARIVGTAQSRAAALQRVREVAPAARPLPLSGFSLAELEHLAAREQITLRALLEDLRAAGLELIAEAPFDLLHDARRAIEEVNISGLALGRLTIDRLPTADVPTLFKEIAALQQVVGVDRKSVV